jgi:xylan 1,4-beta-xylosidase
MKKQQVTIKILFFLFALWLGYSGYSQSNQFSININDVAGENTEFWKAAGSDHLFYHVMKPSGQSLLNRMDNTNSHKYLRTHHTFKRDLNHGVPRGQEVYSEDENGNPVYDFSNVNKVFGEYVKRGIKPIVEYDYMPKLLEFEKRPKSIGNDEGMGMRNTGPKDWKKWSDLMKAATRNFIDVFGEEEVRTWYFEVWNEPDGWPIDQMDVFFRMYDVFVDAIHSVDSTLKVGGPACYHEYFLKPFLQHVARGKNYVTGKTGTRIDFISYHIYGLSGKWLNNEPHIYPTVNRFTTSVLWLQRLMKEFKELKGIEFHLNEWGMSSNYYRTVQDYPNLIYRNNIESPLFLVKLVNSLYQIEDNYRFPISMLLYWGFSWEADEDEFFVNVN